jgi:hypothetical protein
MGFRACEAQGLRFLGLRQLESRALIVIEDFGVVGFRALRSKLAVV